MKFPKDHLFTKLFSIHGTMDRRDLLAAFIFWLIAHAALINYGLINPPAQAPAFLLPYQWALFILFHFFLFPLWIVKRVRDTDLAPNWAYLAILLPLHYMIFPILLFFQSSPRRASP